MNGTYFHALPREKSAIIKLRNFGHSIHNIAQGLGRSTSFIFSVIVKAKLFGLIRCFDNRKMPNLLRIRASHRLLNSCLVAIGQWTSWILGEDCDPP